MRFVITLLILLGLLPALASAATVSYPLTVSLPGGNGSITSAPSGIACTKGTCTANFSSGTTVSLLWTPSNGAQFAGWGGDCSGTASCSVTMNSAHSLTATFLSRRLLQLDDSSTPHMSLSTAYGDAANNSRIKSRNAVINGDALLAKAISVKLDGGYNDDFTATSGYTTIQGALFIRQGKVTVSKIKIGTKAVSDFAIAPPAAVSTRQGTAGTSIISTTASGGFNAPLALAAYGIPAGATAIFSPASISAPGSGRSTLTLSAGQATPIGTHPIMVSATGGGTTHLTNLLFTVTAAPDFSLDQPTPVSVIQGGSGNCSISTSVTGGFSYPLTLSASNLPAGVTAVFSPASIAAPGSGSTTLTLTASAWAPPGVYDITVSAVGGGKTRSAAFKFRVSDAAVQTGSVVPLVSGLQYETATQKGLVAVNGTYYFRPGEQVTFSLGGMEVATVRASQQVNLLPLESETASLTLLRLLKALDGDNDLGNGVQLPSMPVGNIFPITLNSEAGTGLSLLRLNPFKVLPPSTDAQAASLLHQAQRTRSNPAGTYTSFLVTGAVEPAEGSYIPPSACSTPTITPVSGTITLTSSIQWESAAPTGSATLLMSDGSTARFNLTGNVGSISLNGTLMRYLIGPVKSGSTRAISLLTQNADGEPCSQSLMYLRDRSQFNQPPIAMVNWVSIDFPFATGAPFTYNFTSSPPSGPDEFGKGSQDPDGRVVSRLWTSSKGSTGTGSDFKEEIGPQENVTFSLTVTDDEGASSTKSWTVGNIARSAEEAAAFVNSAGGLYGVRDDSDTTRIYLKFDQANNLLYIFECATAAKYCNQAMYNHDLAGAGLRALLEKMRFLIPGHFVYGDTGLQFNVARELPWGYIPGGAFPELATAPAFSLTAGNYQGAQTLEMSTDTPGAMVYYTKDGTDPSAASLHYTGPLTLTDSATIKAITIANGYKNSAVSVAAYTITFLSPAQRPAFSLASGSYVGAQSLQMSSATPNAVIRYTTDGSNPTPDSARYTGPIALQSSANFKAVTTASGFSDSAIATASYTITSPPPPQPVLADCAATNVVWQTGSAQCLAYYPGGKSGTSATVVDSTAPVTGAATSYCSNGSVTTAWGNCTAPVVPPPPPPARSGLVVTEQEYFGYDNARCSFAGPQAMQFGLQVKNLTTETVDIRVCHPWTTSMRDCFVYADVKPGQVVPNLTRFANGAWGPPHYECRSQGVYTIEWTTPDAEPGVSEYDFGRAPNGEMQLIEMETLISPNVVPYGVVTVQPITGGTIPSRDGGITLGTTPVQPPVTAPTVPVTGVPSAAEETVPDADGCYIPRHDPECVLVEQTRWLGDELIVRYRNNCGKRVYGTFCNMQTDGKADCGALEILPGGSDTSWTYRATGVYMFKYTGSTKASSDWVCADKDASYKATNLELLLGAKR